MSFCTSEDRNREGDSKSEETDDEEPRDSALYEVE